MESDASWAAFSVPCRFPHLICSVGIPILKQYLNKENVRLNLNATTKQEILAELVQALVENGIVQESAPLLDALLDREALGSTGIGYGVAIPHGRCQEVSQPTVVFGRTRQEIEFDSIDGKPARIFFLLVAPDNGGNDHLYLLAKIARLMKDEESREKLLSVESPEEVVVFFTEQDAQ